MKLTANPVPAFFRLGFQTRAEQEDPTSDSRERAAKSLCQNTTTLSREAWGKITQSGQSRAVQSERRQFEEKSIPVLSKIEDGVILAPCSQPEAWPPASPGAGRGKLPVPGCETSASSSKSMNPFWHTASPSFWGRFLILNQLIGRMRSWAFCNSREGFHP